MILYCYQKDLIYVKLENVFIICLVGVEDDLYCLMNS